MTEHPGVLLERDTKTHRSQVVEVPASVLAELRTHVELSVGGDPGILVFTTPVGDPVRLSNWRHRVWDPLAAELGLPGWATPYVLRHTAASLLAQSGGARDSRRRLPRPRPGHLPEDLRPPVPG
jgi:integrase